VAKLHLIDTKSDLLQVMIDLLVGY